MLSIVLPTLRLGIARIMDLSKCKICSHYQLVRDCVYLSYLNTHKFYFGRPDGLQPCKIRGAPELDSDRPWSPVVRFIFWWLLHCEIYIIATVFWDLLFGGFCNYYDLYLLFGGCYYKSYYLVAAATKWFIIWWLLQLWDLLFSGWCNYEIYSLVAAATMRFIIWWLLSSFQS